MTLPKVAIDRLRQLKKIQDQDARIRKAFGPNRKIEDAILFCRTYLEFNDFKLVPNIIDNPKDVWIDYEEVYEIFSYPDNIQEGEMHPEWRKQLDFCQAFLLECGYREIVDIRQNPKAIERDVSNLATTTSNTLNDFLVVCDSTVNSNMAASRVLSNSWRKPETFEYRDKVDVLYMDGRQIRELKEYSVQQALDGLMKLIKRDLEKYVELKQERVSDIDGDFICTKAKITLVPVK